MRRRLWGAVGVVLLVGGSAACATDDGAEVRAQVDDAPVEEVEEVSDVDAVVPPAPAEASLAAAAVARAAENTLEVPAYEFTMVVEADLEPSDGAGPETLLTGEGVSTDGGQRTRMTFELTGLSSVLDGMPGSGEAGMLDGLDRPIEVVTDGDTTYVRGGPIGAFGGDRWIALPASMGSGMGIGDPTGGLGDPTALLELLAEAGEVVEVGQEQLDGRAVTHHEVVLDLAALADEALADAGLGGGSMTGLPSLDGTTATVGVWVDDETDRVRRLAVVLDAGPQVGAAGSATFTIDLVPLDEPVEIALPDPAEVDDLGELGGLGGLLEGLGG